MTKVAKALALSALLLSQARAAAPLDVVPLTAAQQALVDQQIAKHTDAHCSARSSYISEPIKQGRVYDGGTPEGIPTQKYLDVAYAQLSDLSKAPPGTKVSGQKGKDDFWLFINIGGQRGIFAYAQKTNAAFNVYSCSALFN